MGYESWIGIIVVVLTAAIAYLLHTILKLICGSEYRDNGYGDDAYWQACYLSVMFSGIASLNTFYALGVPASQSSVTFMNTVMVIASVILIECIRENVVALRRGCRYKTYIHQL